MEKKEAFGNGAVVAVTSAAHTGLYVIGLQKSLQVRANEQAALDALLSAEWHFASNRSLDAGDALHSPL